MKKILVSLILGGLIAHSTVTVASDKMKKFAITVTNTHAFHVLTPIVVASHKPDFALFKVGEPASEGLAYQAEFGDPSMLLAELSDNPKIFSSTTNGAVLLPGKSVTLEIMAPKRSWFSISSMLAGTNDAIVAVKNIKAPRRSHPHHAPIMSIMTHVYDAGSEADNEDCAYIPGPPCAPASGNLRAPENAEGFVSISNGVHGGVDLNPMDSDWRESVAVVSVKRL